MSGGFDTRSQGPHDLLNPQQGLGLDVSLSEIYKQRRSAFATLKKDETKFLYGKLNSKLHEIRLLLWLRARKHHLLDLLTFSSFRLKEL